MWQPVCIPRLLLFRSVDIHTYTIHGFFHSNILRIIAYCAVFTLDKLRVRWPEMSFTLSHQIRAFHLLDRCCLPEMIYFASRSECLFKALNIKHMIHETYTQKGFK